VLVPGMKTAWAFEGCSCRAAFHVGVVEWLTERGWHPDAVAGASSGSLVAAAVALKRVHKLRDGWEALLGTNIFQPRHLLRGRWPYRMSHILKEALEPLLEQRRMTELQIPTAITVTQIGWRGRRERVISNRDDIPIHRAIRASSFLPGPYSRMIAIDGRPTVDGAWRERVPLTAAAGLGCDRIVAVVANPEGRLIRGYLRAHTVATPPNVQVLAPIRPLPLVGFDFHHGRTMEAIQIGRESAEAFYSAT
jgi:NTE family protein